MLRAGGLGLGDLFLQRGRGGVALAVLGDDEAEGDKLVRVGELEQIVPVSLVEAG